MGGRRKIKKIAVGIDAKDILDRIPEKEKKGCSGLLIGNVDTKYKDRIIIECILFDNLQDTTDDIVWLLFKRKRVDEELNNN